MELGTAKPTTERGLVAALAARGRSVSLADIANWRKNGLLPPLVSHGLGRAKGKSYCWQEQDIVARAVTIFDAIQQQSRSDHAILMLFLSGFEVPLPLLRRAWAARLKQRKPPEIRQVNGTGKLPTSDAAALLLQPVLAVDAAIRLTENSAFVVQAVEHGLARLGYGRRGNAAQLCGIMGILAMALENSDVIHKAEAADIGKAQQTLTTVLKFLDGGMEKRDRLIEAIGPTLFTYILALLRSGQTAMLDSIVARITALERPVSRPIRVAARAVNAAV